MLRDYGRLIAFSIGLLVGIQLPGFVDQYAKRVEAHYLEAQRSFSGFRATADRYFNGSIPALLAHHQKSGDRVFIDEARNIEALQTRLDALAAESAALRTSLLKRIIHMVFAGDREILQETFDAFSYTVPLSPPAIACGVLIGCSIALGLEALLLGVARLIGVAMVRSRQRHRAPVRDTRRP